MKLELMTGHRLAPFLGLIASTFLWAATPTDIDTSRSEMRTTIERYVADWTSLTRAYPIDNSAGQRDRMVRFYREWLDRLPALDFESMSQEGRIDYLLFRNHVQHEVRQLELKTKAEAATAPYMPFAQTIAGLEESRRRMETIDPAKAAAPLDALVKRIDSTRKDRKSTRLNSKSPDHLVCRLLLEKKKNLTENTPPPGEGGPSWFVYGCLKDVNSLSTMLSSYSWSKYQLFGSTSYACANDKTRVI